MHSHNIIHAKVKPKQYLIFMILTLLTVLMSKTVVAGIIYFKYFNILFLLICILILLTNKIKIDVNNLVICFILILFLVFSYSIHTICLGDPTGLTLTKNTIIEIFQALIVVSYIEKRDYENIYINIMVLMSIISLICFLLSILNPSFASSISSHAFTTDSLAPIHASFYYTWGFGIHLINLRNSGMFWEPGAFQGFLCIAILILILTNYDIKNSFGKLIILVVTLLTTGSTTGYIILMLILIVFYNDIINLFRKKTSPKIYRKNSKILILLFTAVFTSVAIMYILKSTTLIGKLNEDNFSTNIRTNDVLNSIKLFLQHPLFGTSFGKLRNIEENKFGVINNSSGLLMLFYLHGSFFAIYYLYSLKKGIYNFFKPKVWVKKICIYLIFLLLFLTEGLYWLPVYLCFIYKWSNNKDL